MKIRFCVRLEALQGRLVTCFQGLNLVVCAEALKRPLEGLALGFVLIASLSMYLYGALWILPFIFGQQSFAVQLFVHIAAVWCLFGIWTNLLLIRFRNSSIRHRILTQPVILTQPALNGSPDRSFSVGGDASVRDRKDSDQMKNVGQQFMASPFGNDAAWHICGACEVYVPPRTWHCSTCNICILRRDHHCVFAMACIGEDNHVNFLGLLAYLSIGATYATIVAMLYSIHHFETSAWWFFFRSFFSWYVLLFDRSIFNGLSSISLLGGAISWVVFFYYIRFALKNQTSADHSRGIRRSLSPNKQYSYANMKCFLGPNPIFRILWPLSPVLKTDYGGGSRLSQFDAAKTV